MKNYSDSQLIADYLGGDEKSLEILIGRYLKPIYNFVYGYVKSNAEAEDITQEVFVKMWRNLKKFDREKKFKTWLFTIAKNTCFDFFKKKRAIPLSNMEIFADSSSLSQEVLEKTDMGQILKTALEKISLKSRQLLFLRYDNHFTFHEIAELLGEPLHTIKSRHRRALIKLKRLLANQ